MACCLVAPSHYVNQFDLSSIRSRDIHLRAISQSIPQLSTTENTLQMTFLKLKSPRGQLKDLPQCTQSANIILVTRNIETITHECVHWGILSQEFCSDLSCIDVNSPLTSEQLSLWWHCGEHRNLLSWGTYVYRYAVPHHTNGRN